MNIFGQDFTQLDQPAEVAAPRLLGATLSRLIDGQWLRGKIVETEAYDQRDAASHSYRGKTPRTEIMFGPSGFMYVYFTYGMHYCCNVVVGGDGHGSAVLLRALEPLDGLEQMERNRHGRSGLDLTNGPAKLCQALAITRADNGTDLRGGAVRLELASPLPQEQIVQTTRIGITQAKDVPWRFYIRNNPFVSKV